MKMKTTKFLAVLAVLAMAFAVIAFLPAQGQDAATGDGSSPLADGSTAYTDAAVTLGSLTFTPYVQPSATATYSASTLTVGGYLMAESLTPRTDAWASTGFTEDSWNNAALLSYAISFDSSKADEYHYYVYQKNSVIGGLKVTPITATAAAVDKATGANPSFEFALMNATEPTEEITVKIIKSDTEETFLLTDDEFNGIEAGDDVKVFSIAVEDGTVNLTSTNSTEITGNTAATAIDKTYSYVRSDATITRGAASVEQTADIRGLNFSAANAELLIFPGKTLTINMYGTMKTGIEATAILTSNALSIIGLSSTSKIVINDNIQEASVWANASGKYNGSSLAIGTMTKGTALKDITISKVNLTVNGEESKRGFGIAGDAVTINDGAKVTIKDSNRALQNKTSFTVSESSTVVFKGGEAGIKGSGTITVGSSVAGDKSSLTAALFNPAGFNGGNDDRWGIRAEGATTIFAGSTLTADGFFSKAADVTVNGTLNINASDLAGYYDIDATTKEVKGTFVPSGLVVAGTVTDGKIAALTGNAVIINAGGAVNIAKGAYILGTIQDATSGTISKAVFGTVDAAGTATAYYAHAILVSGNATFSHGSVDIVGDFTTNADGSITINSGTVKISGELDVALDFADAGAILEIISGKTLTIGENGSITTKVGADNATFKVNVGGTLAVAGTLSGTVDNKGEIDLLTGGDIKDVTITGDGKVVDKTDDDDMKELIIGGDSEGKDTVFSAKQKVIVSSELGYWNLNKGSDVTILGALVIPEGTTLTVQAGATLIIDNEAKVYVYGKLVIDDLDGTVAAGAFNIITGFVSVEGKVTIDGTLTMTGAQNKVTEVDVEDGGEFVIGETGAFTLTNQNYTEFFVAEGGELTVYGLMGSTIWNSGTITIDSDVAATSPTTIYMWTAGATVDVKNYTVLASAAADTTLTISDKGLIFTTYREGTEDIDVYLGTTEDEVVISMTMTDATSDYSITFSGLEVVSGFTTKAVTTPTKDDKAETGYYNNKQYSKYLDVSGMFYVDYTYIGSSTGADKTVAATVSTTTSSNVKVGDKTLSSYCAVKVTDEIVINDYVTLNNAGGILTVTGSIDTMSKDAKVTNANTATITVADAGSISCVINTIISETGINAAKFMTVATDIYGKTYKIYNYYSIDGALAVVAAEPVTSEIIILGSQTMKASASLPAGISLVLINSGASLTINKDVAFEIAAGATLKGEGTVTVNGSMYANEKTDVKNSVTVISDVKTEEMDAQGKPTKTGWALWTNLTDALAAAEAGDVITITKKTTSGSVTVSKNLIIPDGVTLVAPKDFDPLLLKNGVTLTIDGILVVGSNIYAEQAFGLDAQNTSGATYKARYSSAIVVNGALISATAIEYGNGAADTVAPTKANANKVALIDDEYAVGRAITFVQADPTKALETATAVKAPIAGAYYAIKDGNVTYEVISSLEFAAENLDKITRDIIIHGDVSALILTFEKTDYFDIITVNDDDKITAPTSMATGSAVATELTVATLVLNEVSLVSTAHGTFTGIVGNGTDALTCVDVKNMTVLDKDDKLYVHGAVTADTTGAGLAITAGAVYLGTSGTGGTQFAYTGTNTTTIKNYLIVADDAEAIVENCGTINLLWIEGYFGVPAAKGANVTNLVDLGEVEVAAVTETTAKGTLNITDMFVGLDAAPADAEIYAVASISGPIALTGTAYVMGDAEVGVDTALYLATLKFTTFMVDDEEYYTVFDGNTTTQALVDNKLLVPEAKISGWYSEDGKEVKFGTTKVGDYPVVYAKLNYNIYSVYIVTDAGVKSVAINGIEMVNQNNNVFTLGVDDKLTPLITGTYKVTYTLKSGYQEDKNGVTLYTEDGTILKDLKFEASGASDLKTIKLQLNGTEIIPEPEPTPTPEEKSEWTVTTILLCVLVVLIAIMAVIVALRLNRN